MNVLAAFNSLFGKLFEFLFLPFRNLSPWYGMIFISLLTALFMLFIFRYTSNQTGIKRVKDKIKAHLLELRLYKENMGTTLRAQGKIFRCNIKYIGYSAKPMLVMIIPLVLILAQLNLWFGYDSLAQGERTIVKVKLEDNLNPMDTEAILDSAAAIAVETPPLRIEEEKEICWRIRAKGEGKHALPFTMNGEPFSKTIVISPSPLAKISPLKASRILDGFLYPGESPLPKNLPVKAVEVIYPAKRLNLFGLKLHWLVAYFALSIIFAFALKRPFKVEV